MYILAGDHHGTAQLQVSAATAAYVKRRFDPFGNARGGGTVTGGSSWNGDHGFLDKPVDTSATNLAQIGDRYYDLVIGRFISVDPELDATDTAQANAYAGNNPVTMSDPSGRYAINDDGTRAPSVPYYPVSPPVSSYPGGELSPAHTAVLASAASLLPQPIKPPPVWDLKMAMAQVMGVPADDGSDLMATYKKQWVHAYVGSINESAKLFDIPSKLLGGVAFIEVAGDPVSIDWFAEAKRQWDGGSSGWTDSQLNTSFGNVSMQLDMAAVTMGYDPRSLSGHQAVNIAASLMDPQQNLLMAAKHLSDLRNQTYDVGARVNNSRMQRIAALYNGGPYGWKSDAAQDYGDFVVGPFWSSTTRTSSTAMYILAGDHHGTAQLQVSAATAAYVKRRFDPFGNARGGGTVTGGSGWNGDHGFLDKPIDTAASNLAQIGDRYYDLVIGRFISVDPELDTTDSAQANAYAYAGNNPVTLSDPTGRYPINDDGTRAPTIPYYPTPSGGASSNGSGGGSSTGSSSGYPPASPPQGPQVCTRPVAVNPIYELMGIEPLPWWAQPVPHAPRYLVDSAEPEESTHKPRYPQTPWSRRLKDQLPTDPTHAIGGVLSGQQTAIDMLAADAPGFTRLLGASGGALTQIAQDSQRDDLNTRQKWTRPAVEGTISAGGDFVGGFVIGVGCAGSAFFACGAAVTAGTGAAYTVVGTSNVLLDYATDNVRPIRWLLGDFIE